eukprot:15482594-Alexandrium_andersonii.AAC.1
MDILPQSQLSQRANLPDQMCAAAAPRQVPIACFMGGSTLKVAGPTGQISISCPKSSLGGPGHSSPNAERPSPRLGVCRSRSPPIAQTRAPEAPHE